MVATMITSVAGCGIGSTSQSDNKGTSEVTTSTQSTTDDFDSGIIDTVPMWMDVNSAGPCGTIFTQIPEGWDYKIINPETVGTEQETYGLEIKPQGKKGELKILFDSRFGYCGTDTKSKEITVADCKADRITEADGQWIFTVFHDRLKNLVAINTAEWTDDELEQIDKIFMHLDFDENAKSGCAFTFTKESEDEDVATSIYLENINPGGATLVIDQFDGEHSGICGEEFKLQKLNGDKWEDVKPIGDNYGFEDIANLIEAGAKRRSEINWENIYGQLQAGTYKLIKELNMDEKTVTLEATFAIGDVL